MKYIIWFASLIVLAVFFTLYLSHDDPASYKLSSVQPWMEQKIQKDLAYYKNVGITKQMVQKAKEMIANNTLPSVFLISITDHKITTFPEKQSKRAKIILDRLDGIRRAGGKLPNTTFLVGNHDHWNLMDQVPVELRDKIPPIFVFAADVKDKYRKHLVLMPDDHTLGNHLIGYRCGWYSIAKEIAASKKDYPWEKKENIAYWRGLDTDTSNYKNGQSPRARLVALSKIYPEKVDAKFNHTPIANEFVVKTLRPIMLMFSIPPYISHAKQLKYKILYNIDGHTSTYPGFLWRLYSGSVTLKQDSANEQWFYDIVRPWEHYVPIDNMLEDSLNKINWILSHDALAKKITQNAVKLVEENLMIEHVNTYLVTLLTRYSELFRE